MRQLALVLLVGCYGAKAPAGAPCAPDGSCPAGLVCSPASNTCEVTAVDAPRMIDARPIDAAPPPPLAYRRRITIHNASTAALPAGFTIRLALGTTRTTLHQQGKVRSDLADLRVIGDGALGERDRIVDSAAPTPAAVSFSLVAPIDPGATDTSYALYYGAPNAGPAPASGSAVFPVYDDFTAGIASFWKVNDGPVTSNGKLVLRAGHTDALTTIATTDNVPIVSAVELLANVVDPNSDGTVQPEGTFWYWFGYQHTGDFSASDPWVVWIARGKGALRTEQKSPVGCEMECDGPTLTQNTASHYYAIERDPSATRFSLDGSLSTTTQVTNNADYSVMVRNFMATSDVQIDWVRARARVSPDPTGSLGTEEKL